MGAAYERPFPSPPPAPPPPPPSLHCPMTDQLQRGVCGRRLTFPSHLGSWSSARVPGPSSLSLPCRARPLLSSGCGGSIKACRLLGICVRHVRVCPHTPPPPPSFLLSVSLATVFSYAVLWCGSTGVRGSVFFFFLLSLPFLISHLPFLFILCVFVEEAQRGGNSRATPSEQCSDIKQESKS